MEMSEIVEYSEYMKTPSSLIFDCYNLLFFNRLRNGFV